MIARAVMFACAVLLASCATSQTVYQPELATVRTLSLHDAINDATSTGEETLPYGSWTHDAYQFSRFEISQDGKGTTAYYDEGRKSCNEPVAFWLGGDTQDQGEVYYDTSPVGMLTSVKTHLSVRQV